MINKTVLKKKLKKTKAGKPKRGGGLIYYIKNDLAIHTTIIGELSSISEDLEQLWVRIDKPKNGVKILANIYRPPTGNLKAGIIELSNSTAIAQENHKG